MLLKQRVIKLESKFAPSSVHKVIRVIVPEGVTNEEALAEYLRKEGMTEKNLPSNSILIYRQVVRPN